MNLECAVSDVDGEAVLHSWGTSVHNTLSSEFAAGRTARDGVEAPESVRVATRRLAGILDEHLPPGRGIDFLSVDVEGHDLQVLQSNDWTRYRPEVVLVEDHGFSPEVPDSSQVARFLREQGYGLRAWVPPSIFLIDLDQASSPTLGW